MQGYLAAIGLALMVILCAVSYTQGKAAGKTECIAERSIAADKVQTAIDLRDQSSATARVDMLDYLRVTVPPIEIKTHETIERIRTVYKDRVITAECAASVSRPQRVQDDLNAARERVNATISPVRLGKPLASATDTGLARDRPVGSNHDGPVRDSSHTAERIQRLPVWLASIGRYPVAP